MYNMKHYDFEISRFIDNELSAGEQKELFSHLSNCEECRNILSDFMEMKKGTESYYDNLPVELKSPVKLLTGDTVIRKRNIYRSLFYMSVAASIILGILFLSKLFAIDRLETKYSALEVKYAGINTDNKGKSQKEFNITTKINNTSFREKGNISSRRNHVIMQDKNKPKLLAANKIEKNPSPDVLKNNNSRFSQKPQEIQIVRVTKNDFLTSQIVGN